MEIQDFFKTVTQTEKMMKEIKQRIITNAIMLNYELWQSIEGYENYEISSFGRVKRFYKNGKTKLLKPSQNTDGYHIVSLYRDRKMKAAVIHQFVANAFLPNPINKRCVDHINNDKLNNNVSNLRWCTLSQNSQNRSLSKNNTSGCKGVCFDQKINKWKAYIKVNGKIKHLGYFNNIEDAIKIRQKSSKEHYGEYQNACER